jgi:hypothetical protein
MAISNLKEIDYTDVLDNPKDYGAPTFEEFAKNPDKYRADGVYSLAEVLASIDNGPNSHRHTIDKFVYEVRGYMCKTPEEAERVLVAEGLEKAKLDYRCAILPNTSYKGKYVVKIAPKEEFERRSKWA